LKTSSVTSTLYHAVYDEAGDTGFHLRSSRYIVGVAVLSQSLHDLQRIAWTVRKDARKGHIRLPELKARLVPEWLVYTGLNNAMRWEWSAIIAVIDKGSRQHGPNNSEEIYRRLTAHVAKICVIRYPLLHFVVDRRYTKQALCDRLVEAIQLQIAASGLNAILTIEQAPSEQRKELLLADYLAWAVFQKYERKCLEGYQIVSSRIDCEEIGRWNEVMFPMDEKTAWHPGGRLSPFETE